MSDIQRYRYEDIERAFTYREHEAEFVEYADHVEALRQGMEESVRDYATAHHDAMRRQFSDGEAKGQRDALAIAEQTLNPDVYLSLVFAIEGVTGGSDE